jgi:hypothetical protein
VRHLEYGLHEAELRRWVVRSAARKADDQPRAGRLSCTGKARVRRHSAYLYDKLFPHSSCSIPPPFPAQLAPWKKALETDQADRGAKTLLKQKKQNTHFSFSFLFFKKISP